ncbi:3-methyl-2-oxobutanoate dehydrogenase subunit VorB [Candidatus Haliotispira prima]|uniref:3-methyl-2-oxobutanoate dehydrogenase subunit VorB n=1 Tax=Candidatus Haliotispira prima TaxID=3034016 RepID=A0ABY8MH88_9SPIO|nr:3-methyl-2-oxobutanoate dehydrogenase subunit VorB [Candidatus Haliotispira prima]
MAESRIYQAGENLAEGIASVPKDSLRVLMKGNEALAEATIIAGCRHYFGYPITPQNEIPTYFARRMPEVGGCFLQAESEPASINMVFGAAAAGVRTMTSSSSPGISLMQEGISYLAGAKLPSVVVNVMRGGPGLGNIAGAQGDYNQAVKGGGNGDYHCIVLSPSCAQDIAELTLLAFHLADRYRMVVMLLLDGYLGQMAEPLYMPRLRSDYVRPQQDGYVLDGAEDRTGRKIASIHLGNGNHGLESHVRQLFHTYEEVQQNESRAVIEGLNEGAEKADLLLCAYGMPARLCREARVSLERDGIRVALFQPLTLWPFAEKQLLQALEGVKESSQGRKEILVVEMSQGQFADDVKLHCYGSNTSIRYYGTVGGTPPIVSEIIKKVKQYA